METLLCECKKRAEKNDGACLIRKYGSTIIPLDVCEVLIIASSLDVDVVAWKDLVANMI